MEPISLAFTAFILVKPFIEKTAEGIANQIGEDIWALIKSPFQKNGPKNIEKYAKDNPEEFKKQLELALLNDDSLRISLQDKVEKAQVKLSGSFQQNVNNHGTIDKQVNIQSNTGNISF